MLTTDVLYCGLAGLLILAHGVLGVLAIRYGRPQS